MAHLFSPNGPSSPRSKTHISLGTLPPFIDPKQPPTKKSPWNQIQQMPFTSSVTITTTRDFYEAIRPHLDQLSSTSTPQYAKVILSLSDIITGDFYNTYIRTGDVLLLSSSDPGTSDWHCQIHAGQLKLEMSRHVYEAAGLTGKPTDRNGGARKHTRERWTVDLDLRGPAMVRGRKGFDRLVHAAATVLVEPRVWLFRDLQRPETPVDHDHDTDPAPAPIISTFHPTVVDVEPVVYDVKDVSVPDLLTGTRADLASTPPPPQQQQQHDDYHDLTEWLDLVTLSSPRVTVSDDPDPYISSYRTPGVDDDDDAAPTDLKVVAWTGLLDRAWCTRLLVDVVRASRRVGTDAWVAVAVKAHRTSALGSVDGCAVLLQPGSSEVRGEEMDVDGSEDGGSGMVGDEGAKVTGLQRFVCFQFVDCVKV